MERSFLRNTSTTNRDKNEDINYKWCIRGRKHLSISLIPFSERYSGVRLLYLRLLRLDLLIHLVYYPDLEFKPMSSEFHLVSSNNKYVHRENDLYLHRTLLII